MSGMEDIEKIVEISESNQGDTVVLVQNGESAMYNTTLSAVSDRYGLMYDQALHAWRTESGKSIRVRDILRSPDKDLGTCKVVAVGLHRTMTWEEKSSYDEWVRMEKQPTTTMDNS